MTCEKQPRGLLFGTCQDDLLTAARAATELCRCAGLAGAKVPAVTTVTDCADTALRCLEPFDVRHPPHVLLSLVIREQGLQQLRVGRRSRGARERDDPFRRLDEERQLSRSPFGWAVQL